MGTWEQQEWTSVAEHVPRRERRTGPYSSYLPDTLSDSALSLSPQLSQRIAHAESAVRQLDRRSARGLASVSRFLLRSEAIASSRIEGIAPNAKNVALAELGQTEDVEGLRETSKLVANNMTAVREATDRSAAVVEFTVEHIMALQRSLLTDSPQLHGLRSAQNWVGGSQHHPLEAEFVPPAPQHVPALMDDLVQYINGAAHSPLVQAALVHAQFETVHPFADGNGRVGRALIHTVLTRRGLTEDSILPVSLVLATFRDRYIEGLTAYRAEGASDSAAVTAGRETWIGVFTDAVLQAAERASLLADEIDELREDWAQRVADHRATEGKKRALRSDSAVTPILDGLPGTPVLTQATVARIHDVSQQAAHKALETLREAGVLETASIRRGLRAYVSPDLLSLITSAERTLASTRFDTRLSAPNRPVASS